MTENREHYLITYLKSLVDNDSRGALADLRRGLGTQPGTAPEMYRYIVPLLPKNPSPWQERTFYLIASLFASHPVDNPTGNLGDHMAMARTGNNDDALERRFTALLSAHSDDLPNYLRQTISLLKSKEVPVHWNQLLTDVQLWSHPEYGDRVRKRWATSFWGYKEATPETEE